MKIKFKLLFIVLFGLLLKASAQDIFIVSGKVKNKLTGEPLVGVTVLSEKTNKTTVTDKTGSFSVPTQVGSTIIFSYVGMSTIKYVVTNSENIKIDMFEDIKAGDEVVVIGYGTQKKSVVTGSISSVKATDLENMVTPRIEEALQGRTSGVTIAASSGSPGAASTIYVRGVTSINGSDPLYVVDGVPITGGIDYLNPGDILSIELLKDGASAAIYGTKAAAGVVLITTKKGKAGNFQINFNGYSGTQAPARKLDLLNATQYATLRNESSLAAGTGIVFSNPKSLGAGTDWQSTIFNNSAKIENYQVSISGGNEKSTYYGSLGYFNQDGIVATSISNYKRFTASFNSTVKIKPWLNFGNNVSYAYIKSQGGLNTNSEYGGPLSSAINLDPVTKPVVTDAATLATSPYNIDSLPLIKNSNGNPYGISKYVGQEMTNPLSYIQTQQGNYGFSNNFVGNVYLEVEPIKGLKLKTNIGAKMGFYGSESFTPLYYLSSTVNNLSQNSFYRDFTKNLNWNWDNTASYSKSFGKHNFTALFGLGAQDATGSDVNAVYFGLPVTNFNDASMNYSVATTSKIGGGYEYQPYRLSSTYGRITYDYSGKYLFTGIVRRDGSSHFGDNNKYGTFPSVSVGWVPSKESFWNKSGVVNTLKIRGSYGVNGNDNLSAFSYESTIASGGVRNYTIGNGTGQQTGYSPNAPANPDLKWEQTAQTDLGFDAVFLKYFNITFDAYDKKTTNMLLQLQLPGYVGSTGAPFGNIASLENKGLELELGFNKKIKEVTLSLKSNISYIKNEITNIGANPYLSGATFQASNYEISRTAVGQPLGAFYGFQTVGIFQNQQEINSYLGKGGKIFQPNAKPGDFKYANISGDSTLSSNDRKFIGDPTPHWSIGFTATASWKGFDLLLFAQGVTGNQIFQAVRRLDIANSNYSTKALSRWTGQGTSNDYPRLVDGDPNGNFTNPSNFYLESGAYLRLKTLQIGYTLPKSVAQKLGLQKSARIYISSNNLLTLTKYDGYDPEIGGGSYGIDRGIYPQARSFLVGLNITL